MSECWGMRWGRPSLLHSRYTLLQIFSKFGKIAKLDFLFHKAGPLKGKPRGYAFVEYSNKEVRLLKLC